MSDTLDLSPYRQMAATGIFSSPSWMGPPPKDPHRFSLAAYSYLVDQHLSPSGLPTLAMWNHEAWTNREGVWTHLPIDQLRNELIRWLTTRPTCNFDLTSTNIKNVTTALNAICASTAPSLPCWRHSALADFNITHTPDPSGCVSFRDRIVDVRGYASSSDHGVWSDHIIPRTPAYLDACVIPCNLDRSATCPRWLRFLSEVFEDDTARIHLLRQWFGYCLVSDTSLQKFAFLCGASRSGKSTITTVLTHLLGHSVASTNMQSLGARFGLQHLTYQRLLILPDVPARRITGSTGTSATLKCIVGNDSVYVDRKNIPPGNMVLPIKVMVVSNGVPDFDNTGDAMINRMLTIPFNRSFAGHEDPSLLSTLLSELPGIAWWAVQGLVSIYHRIADHETPFLPLPNSTSINSHVRRHLDPVDSFLRDCLTPVPSSSLPYSTIFDCFDRWYEDNDFAIEPPTHRTIAHAMNRLRLGTRTTRSVNGSPLPFRAGVALSPDGLKYATNTPTFRILPTEPSNATSPQGSTPTGNRPSN